MDDRSPHGLLPKTCGRGVARRERPSWQEPSAERTGLSSVWAGDAKLCGSVGEKVVGDALEALAGYRVWTGPRTALGKVDRLQGRAISVGGPLDAAGEWPVDPTRLATGATAFAVEVKNVRSILYPYDHDVWDLLAKLHDFPDVLPILIARRCHWTTFRMFKDIGALASETRTQYFSSTIPAAGFDSVVQFLGLPDAARYLGGPPNGLLKFFGVTGPRLAPDQIQRWRRATDVVRNYLDLRDEGLDPASRSEMFTAFANELNDAGLYEGGWAAVFPEEAEPDWGFDDI